MVPVGTRVKAINSTLDIVAKQTEECRTQLASIISAGRLRECQGFIDKVSEIRFTKVRQRQLNKFNILINKKEGNITSANAINLTLSNNLGSQAGRQASTSLPPGKVATQTSRQAGTLLPSREGRSSAQAIAHLPPREGSNSTPAGSQSGALLPPNSPVAIAHLPPSEGSNSLATAHLLLGEGSSSSQAIAHLPSGKGSNSPPAIAHLPPQASNPPQATAHLPPGEGSSTPQATAHPSHGEGNSSPQADQLSNQTRSVRQGLRHSSRHRAPQASQENSTISWEDNLSTTPSRLPQGSSNKEPNSKWVINLSNKPLTPPQRSVLAKGPNFVVTPRQPPNLEYITAIEAACTKLSQQDAEELRADINRVLRSSHPQTQLN